MADGEEVWSAASHKHSDKRLLKLVLTDGAVTLPAVELSTLKSLSRIPLPGEKVMVKNGEVQFGMLIMTDACVSFLGGVVHSLRSEALMTGRDLKGVLGGGGAPKFEAFIPDDSRRPSRPTAADPHSHHQQHYQHVAQPRGGYGAPSHHHGGHDDHPSSRGGAHGGSSRGGDRAGGRGGRGTSNRDDGSRGARGRGEHGGGRGRGGSDHHHHQHGESAPAVQHAAARAPAAAPPCNAALSRAAYDAQFPSL